VRARVQEGCSQVEDVWASPLDQRCPLAHAEAVLLVDHGHREVVEVDLFLDQGMRTDDDVRVAGRDELTGGRVRTRPERARQKADPYAERRAELVDGEKVLLRESLGGRHEGTLASELDGTEKRIQSDHCLPRADLSCRSAASDGTPGSASIGDRSAPDRASR
jgi:hypothetical protein